MAELDADHGDLCSRPCSICTRSDWQDLGVPPAHRCRGFIHHDDVDPTSNTYAAAVLPTEALSVECRTHSASLQRESATQVPSSHPASTRWSQWACSTMQPWPSHSHLGGGRSLHVGARGKQRWARYSLMVYDTGTFAAKEISLLVDTGGFIVDPSYFYFHAFR